MKSRNCFTLVEVLVALSVLLLGILALASLLSSAQRRSSIAEQLWNEQHAMSQAAEYYLLAGTEQDIPERFFPFPDHRVTVRLDNPQDLPPDVSDRRSGWRLVTMRIRLETSGGEVVREMSIDRIIPTGEK